MTLVAYQTFQKRRRDGSLCVISMASAQPKEARDIFQPVMAWIVKSDQCRTLDGQQNSDNKLVNPVDVIEETAC